AELDAAALWAQLRRWTHRLAPLRYLALREARAAICAAAMPGMLATDGAMITALGSVVAPRAAPGGLSGAGGPARARGGRPRGGPAGAGPGEERRGGRVGRGAAARVRRRRGRAGRRRAGRGVARAGRTGRGEPGILGWSRRRRGGRAGGVRAAGRRGPALAAGA